MHEVRTDTVDSIVDQWSATRPDLDFAPLAVFSRISRIDKHLDALRRRAFNDAGLDLAEFDVLSALRRAGEPFALSPTQLLATNLVSSGTMTNRINRLVSRGLVEREADPSDRRSVRVRITPDGKSRVDAAIRALVELEQRVLEDIPESTLTTLADTLRTLTLRLSDGVAGANERADLDQPDSPVSATKHQELRATSGEKEN